MAKKYQVTIDINLEFDADSKEFKETFAGYVDCIDKKAKVNDMLKFVVYFIVRYGTGHHIEGVGYVKHPNGDCENLDLWSGITLLNDLDDSTEIENN